MSESPTEWLVIWQTLDPDPAGGPDDRLARAIRWGIRHGLRRGFQHMYAMRRATEFRGWIVCNPTLCGDAIIEVGGDGYLEDVVIPMTRTPDAHMLRLRERPADRLIRPGAWRCVSAVGRLLNIQPGPFETPYRFYRRMHYG